MNMIVAKQARVSAPPALIASRNLTVMDPLDADDPADEAVVTTRRAICRVALVATEVGGRFQREAIDHDPMSWMLSPRRLFGGSSALDACLELRGPQRVISNVVRIHLHPLRRTREPRT